MLNFKVIKNNCTKHINFLNQPSLFCIMKEVTLLKIAVICSLVGLIVLYFISSKIEIGDYKPNLLNKNVGENVKLTGTITKISQGNGVVFVEVNQENPINVVLFADSNSLKEGNIVEILGKVQDYNGKEEIIADKIRIIKS